MDENNVQVEVVIRICRNNRVLEAISNDGGRSFKIGETTCEDGEIGAWHYLCSRRYGDTSTLSDVLECLQQEAKRLLAGPNRIGGQILS